MGSILGNKLRIRIYQTATQHILLIYFRSFYIELSLFSYYLDTLFCSYLQPFLFVRFTFSYRNQFCKVQIMEKVPQIHLFGTGESFKRSPSPSYAKQYTYPKFNDTWTSSFSYHTKPFFTNNTPAIPRSNSATLLNIKSNGFQTNYYQNAIKICEQNRVLNKKGIHVQSYGYLKGSYLKFHNHNHQNLRAQKQCNNYNTQCLQCANQSIKRSNLKQQNNLTYSFKNTSTQNNLQQLPNQQQPTYSPILNKSKAGKQNVTQYVSDDRAVSSQNKPSNEVESQMKSIHKTGSNKAVSFNEIVESCYRQKQDITVNKNTVVNVQYSQLNHINTERSQTQQFRNLSLASIQSHCPPKQKSKNNLFLQKLQEQKKALIPNITKMIQEMNENDLQLKRSQFLIEQLQQITRQNMQIQKDYIRKLDDIIERFDTKQTCHIIIKPYSQVQSYSPNTNTKKLFCSNGVQSQKQKQKKRMLYVTQGQAYHA